MITDAIFSFFTVIVNLILSPLEVFNVGIDILSSIPVVMNFLSFVGYVIPWTNLIPIFTIIVAILGFKIIVALIHFIVSLIPFM